MCPAGRRGRGAPVEARPERENQKSASRAVFIQAQKLREEAKKSARLRSRPKRLGGFLSRRVDLESRTECRVRVSRRRFVSTPALFSRLSVHTYCPRESLHPRRSKCRCPRKGIVRANASIFNPSIDPERSRCPRRCGEKGSMIGPKRLAQIPMRGSEAHSVDRSRTPCRIAGKARRAVRAA